jgi:hypothetical protein
MQKKTVSREVYVTDDGLEFANEDEARTHEYKVTVLTSLRKRQLIEKLDSVYHAVYVDDKGMSEELVKAFNISNPSDLVNGWNLIKDESKVAQCYPIKTLLEKASQPMIRSVEWSPESLPPTVTNSLDVGGSVLKIKRELTALITKYQTDPALKTLTVGAILGGLLIDLEILVNNN